MFFTYVLYTNKYMKRLLYHCPMHPEIEQDTPGTCSKCGMQLVHGDAPQNLSYSYVPLFVIIAMLVVVTSALTLRDLLSSNFMLSQTLSYFMIGFFITFAGFKLMDLKGFAEGYASYDLIAKRVPVYGYIYPFIELFFGLSMIFIPESISLLWTEVAIMTVSGLGVTLKLLKNERFQCACLGTFLKVPLTKVTLVEDFGMALLALTMLLLA